MSSPAQVLANRNNSAASTGPKSAEGKFAVSFNAVTHGLAAQRFFLLENEDETEWKDLVESQFADWKPTTAIEQALVLELAQLEWKKIRLETMEAKIWGKSSDFDVISGALLKLQRYFSGVSRAWYRAFNALLKIQSQRKKEQQAALRAQSRELAIVHRKKKIEVEQLLESVVGVPKQDKDNDGA